MTILQYVRDTFKGKRIMIDVASDNSVSLPTTSYIGKIGNSIGRVLSVYEMNRGNGEYIEMTISYRYEVNCEEEVAKVKVELNSEIILYN